jgi:hypothetical protein
MRRSVLVISLLAAGLGSAASADEPPPVAAPSTAGDVVMKEHADEIASYTMRASLDPGAHTIHTARGPPNG